MQTITRVSPLLLAATLTAQVPVGFAVNAAMNGSSTPLVVVDRTPTVTNIAGAVLLDINCLRIDPMDGSVWMASAAGVALRRGRINFTARRFVNDTLAATVPTADVAAIAFDLDGNPVIAGGTLNLAGGIWRVDRNTGSVTTLVDAAAGLRGEVNAIDEDAVTGDLYFGVFFTGNVYKISPPYARNSQTFVGTIASATNPFLSGLSFARPPAAPLGLLYISTFATDFNSSICTMDPVNGAVLVIAGTPTWYEANWVDYDAVRNDLWVNSTFEARSISKSTTAGANTLLHQIPNGTPACIEVNDVDPNGAELRVCPRNVRAPAAPIRLELTVAGKPGEVGVIATVSPVLSVLGVGPVGADGLFSLAIPGVVYPAGSPGSIRFVAGTVDTGSLAVKFSTPIGWPRN